MRSIFYRITALICIITFFSGCVSSTIWYRDMDLSPVKSSQSILNLKYFGDREFVSQGKDIMKSGSNEQEYGYYSIMFRSKHSSINISDFYASDKLRFFNIATWNWSGAGWGFVFLIPFIAAMYALYLTPLIGSIALSTVGVPFDTATFNITAELYIFDSAGNLVGRFEETTKFKQVAGFYYGFNPTKKAAKKFSNLFSEIINDANYKSSEINQALRAAGPITASNSAQAVQKMNEYFDTF